MRPIASRLTPMPAAPRNISGLRPHLSTVAMATTVDKRAGAANDDLLQHAGIHAGRGAHVLEDGRAEVEEDVDAGDLLQDGQQDAHDQRQPQRAARTAPPSCPVSVESAARMLASSALAKSSPATLVRMVLACSARPISTSQRGLSGIRSSSRRRRPRAGCRWRTSSASRLPRSRPGPRSGR